VQEIGGTVLAGGRLAPMVALAVSGFRQPHGVQNEIIGRIHEQASRVANGWITL
jgi:hypothetical protein